MDNGFIFHSFVCRMWSYLLFDVGVVTQTITAFVATNFVNSSKNRRIRIMDFEHIDKIELVHSLLLPSDWFTHFGDARIGYSCTVTIETHYELSFIVFVQV